MPAVVFGAAVVTSGLLLACAVRLREAERIRAAIGLTRPPRRGKTLRGTAIRSRLASRAIRHRWPGKAWSYPPTLLGAAAGGLLLGWHLAGPVGAVVAMAGGPAAVEAFLSHRLAADSDRLEGQLRDAVTGLAAAVRAGLSVRRGVQEVADMAEPPLRQHLRSVVHRMKLGEPPDVALAGLAERVSLPDLPLIINALSVDRRTGGNLPALLDEIGGVIAQRSDARREVRALTAQGRASGAVLVVLPVAFVALLSGTGGDSLGAFYRTPLGSVLLLIGLACAAAGHFWIRRILADAEADR